MDFWCYCQPWIARILSCHFIALLFKLYKNTSLPAPTATHTHHPQVLRKETWYTFPSAGWRASEWHHLRPLKRTSSQGWNGISAFPGFLPSYSVSNVWDAPHYPALFTILSHCPIGNLIKRESQNINQPHLQILLQVCCLFVQSRWGKGNGKSRAMGRLSSQLSSSAVGFFPVGATGDLGPVFAFLGTHRGGVCSWRHWGCCQRPCWSWDYVIPGSKISSARSNGEHFDLGKCSHAGTLCPPDSSPYFSNLKQSNRVTSGHTQLRSTIVSELIPCISLGNSPQWTQTRLQTASDLAEH